MNVLPVSVFGAVFIKGARDMRDDVRPDMPNLDPLLTLTQWMSPAFPVGAFAYSSGLEAAVQAGWVTPGTLQSWLTGVLTDGQGQSDAILIHAASRGEDVSEVDLHARALCPSHERLIETTRLGAAFCGQLRDTWALDVPDLCYPVALGVGCRAFGFDAVPAVQLFLQAFASNMIGCAQRLMPLGQTDGQRILATLGPDCVRIASDTAHVPLDEITSQSFAADIASMRHETQSPRIFRT